MNRFVSLDIGPNYQLDDAKIAIKSFFGLNSADSKEVTEWFCNYFSTKKVWFYNTCRSGIFSILKALDLDHQSEVLVQGFSCIVVPNAVLQANLKPVICDVSINDFNFDLEQIESKITKNTKVWILQYNFGIVPDMEKVQTICRKYNLILIEDCAHSLGAKFSIKGIEYKVGEFGHAAAFSFGRDKVISTTTGGSIVFNQHTPLNKLNNFKQIQVNLSSHYDGLKKMTRLEVTQNLFYVILTSILIKPIYNVGIGKILAYIAAKLKLAGRVYTTSEKNLDKAKFPAPKKYSPRLFALLNNQLNKLNYFNDHRRRLAKIYAEQLNLNFDDKNIYLRFPIFLPDTLKLKSLEQSQQAYSYLLSQTKKQGYFLGKWYFKVFLGAAKDDQKIYHYDLNTLPNVNSLIQKQTLNLPTNISTTERDAYNLSKIIKKSINNNSL
ncbi:MAG: aminotransferase class I/II-fold pyridoxal phosphate-dependent enzyme [Patescibacteria group bacterium]